MKDILIQGHRIATTDAVADAVLEYAQLLAREQRSDVIELPIMHDGVLARCAMLLTSNSHLVVVGTEERWPGTLAGAEEAAAEILRRAHPDQ